MGKVLASHTSIALNGNHLVNFVNKSVSLRYLVSSDYYVVFTKWNKGLKIKNLLGYLTGHLILLLHIPKCGRELKAM